MTATTSSDRARAAAGMNPQPGKELSRIEAATREHTTLVERMRPRFVQVLADQAKGDRFIIDAITALRTVPKLALCTDESFLGSLMTAAQLDLRPNVGALGHCWVLPFENKKAHTVEAQFILGYRGMITVAGRSGVTVNAHTIYALDEYEIRFGIDDSIHHRPPIKNGVPVLDRHKRGEPVAHYAICRSTTGGIAWRVISHDEALEARDASPGYKFGGPDNPWRKDEENGWPMCRKTIVRRTFPYVVTDSPGLAMAFAADDRVITLDQNTGQTTIGDEPLMTVSRADVVDAEAATEPADADKTKPAAKARRGKTKATQREPQPATPKRQALAAKLAETHGDQVTAALTVALNGERHDVVYITDDELQAAIDLTPEQIADWQQDQAHAATEDGK
jgi:recombination protein RecT